MIKYSSSIILTVSEQQRNEWLGDVCEVSGDDNRNGPSLNLCEQNQPKWMPLTYLQMKLAMLKKVQYESHPLVRRWSGLGT